ncbi:hypothetical protein PsYK624_134100 [Phanerochaete sordida]|uniref:Uncharacterized protein n=1 Tax=Phanerochaete sordida TaxID=48140 RepID=A0A9P3LKF5_9APHY|nr:hypothetical protein PsYK624_134100 [Phanerochaete sordida]
MDIPVFGYDDFQLSTTTSIVSSPCPQSERSHSRNLSSVSEPRRERGGNLKTAAVPAICAALHPISPVWFRLCLDASPLSSIAPPYASSLWHRNALPRDRRGLRGPSAAVRLAVRPETLLATNAGMADVNWPLGAAAPRRSRQGQVPRRARDRRPFADMPYLLT